MSKYQDLAEKILKIPINKAFFLVSKEGIKVSQNKFKIDATQGLLMIDKYDRWVIQNDMLDKLFLEHVFPQLCNSRLASQKHLQHKSKKNKGLVSLTRENWRNQIYNKLLHNQMLNTKDIENMVHKSFKTIQHWEKTQVVPKSKKINGKRAYSLEDVYIFLKCLLEHTWERKTLDFEELRTIYNYLDMKIKATTVIKRDKNADPYAFKGDIY